MSNHVRLNPGSAGDLMVAPQLTLLDGSVVSEEKLQGVKLYQGDGANARGVSQTWPLYTSQSIRQTYGFSTVTALTPATTANVPFWVLYGSASKVIKLQWVMLSGLTLTAVAYIIANLAKYSTSSSGGTATTLVKVPLDSTNTASTANLLQGYTAAPTSGTKIGDIESRRILAQATTAAAAGRTWDILFDLSKNKEGSTGIIRGTAEGFGLYFPAAPASAISMSISGQYCEE